MLVLTYFDEYTKQLFYIHKTSTQKHYQNRKTAMSIKYSVKLVSYWLVINFNPIGLLCMPSVFLCTMTFDLYATEYK